MQFFQIILLSVIASVAYGLVHDQITIRICLEYFTVGHPPVFQTASPTLLGLGWGVIATWWMGFFLGIPLAYAARRGEPNKLTARQLIKPVAVLLIAMAGIAFVSGLIAFLLASRGIVKLESAFANALPRATHVPFLVDSWAHSASYVSGGLGGFGLVFWVWHRRMKQWNQPKIQPTGAN